MPDSKKERRRKLAKDIFKLDDYKRYYDLLQNAICFKPISEVSTFVNGFLLNKDNVPLDNLREQIRGYQNIHKMVIKEKEKIAMLKDFTPKAERFIKNLDDIKYLSALNIESKIEKLNNLINRANIELKRLEDEYNGFLLKETSLRETQNRLNIEIHQLENDEAYQALLMKKRQLEQFKLDLSVLMNKLNDFSKMISSEQNIVKDLKLNYRFDDDYRQKDFGLLLAHLENYNDKLKEIEDNVRRDITKTTLSIEDNNRLKKQKEEELNNLKKGINNYPRDVYNLMEIAKNAIMTANPKEKNPEVRPLCEYIEIKDERWSDALEGYLNSRRFNLIFDPKYYDVVSIAYDKYKKERNVYMSGIVNIAAIPSIKEHNNSLITKTEIKNKFAHKYANYLLGDLICVEDVTDLKKYDSSITKEVMVYKNYVLKATSPEIYRIPFIGRDSREKRIKLLNDEINEISSQNNSFKQKLSDLEKDLEMIKNSQFGDLL